MRKVLVGLLAFLGLLVASWMLATSPQQTMTQVVAAVDADDAAALQNFTDLPAVQRSLARQYAQYLMRKMQNDPNWQQGSEPLAERLAERLTAEIITPESLLRLLQGDHQVLMGRLNADNVLDETLRTPLAARTDQTQEYDSPLSYTLSALDKQTHQPMMTLTLAFNGLGWRLTAVQIPMWGTMYEY